jgi:hypothetical protein
MKSSKPSITATNFLEKSLIKNQPLVVDDGFSDGTAEVASESGGCFGHITPNEQRHGRCCKGYFEVAACRGFDALVIVVKHKEYEGMDLTQLKEQMRTSVIVDGRNAYDKAECEQLGFAYKGVGKPREKAYIKRGAILT